MIFSQIKYNPSKRDREILSYVRMKKDEMSTFYREECVRLAQWARDDYEGMSDDKVANMDLMKISLSYPMVNQRCSILYNNQSKADYRTVDESKKYDIEILKKVDEYDKRVGRYNSDYQDIEMTANIEGSCFGRASWEESLDEYENTLGIPHIKQKRVRMNDFWWDQGARTMAEANHGLERVVMTYETYLKTFVPMEGEDGFRNIRAVQPLSREESEDTVWNEDWMKESQDGNGKYVTIWHKESLAVIENGKIVPKCYMIANGVVIYESEKLWIPKRPNEENLLSWFKIDGIPTGTMIGMGIPVLIRHPQEVFNRLITLSAAQAELAVAPPVILGPNVDWDFDDYPLQAGATIRTRKGTGQAIANSYHWFQVPDMTAGAQKMLDSIIEYMIMVTGIDVRALFVPASEKAITTVNKREIQEKMLRFSVQHNEENGFYDLALRRLRLLQHYYPKRRKFMEEVGGEYVQKEGYLKIPIKDHKTEEVLINGKKKIKLNFEKDGYTNIEINPENIQMNVDLVIEGSTSWQEKDSIERKNLMDTLQIIFSVPAFAQKLQSNPDKPMEFILKKAGINPDDIMEIKKSRSQNVHPAMKEIAAIEMMEVLQKQGIKIPEQIPMPEGYEPSEYVDIFNNYLVNGKYDKLGRKEKKTFDSRFDLHQSNANNPLFFDLQEKGDEKEGQPDTGQANVKAPSGNGQEDDLMAKTRQQAAQIANITK